MQGGEALDSTATATTVRVVDGKTITTDGPFAETKETLGGFYLVEAADLDEAIALRRDDPRRAARLHRGPPGLGLRRVAGGRGAGRGRGGELTLEAPTRSLAGPDAAHDVVDRLFREEQGRAVATLIRVTGDFDLAEEAVQDAFISALETWPQRGIPDNPGAWITTTARNRAIDRLRRRKRLTEKTETLAREAALETELRAIDDRAPEDTMQIADDRLRLIFTCCHPALALDARVALTLRTLGGLTTPEIARAFLVPEPTLAQRLVRAKRKIRDAGIPYRVPPAELLPERLDGVLRVLYLVFNEGYAASSGDSLIRRSCAPRRSGWHGSSSRCSPTSPRRRGLLALMLLHDARREARVGAGRGAHPARRPGPRALGRGPHRRGPGARRAGARRRRPGPYQLQAAIASLHDEAATPADTDWAQIAALYGGAPADGALAGRRVEPRGRRRDGRRPGRRPGDDGRHRRGGRARFVPVPARRPGRPAPPPRTLVRGRDRLPPRARAHLQRRRTRLPRRPAGGGPGRSAPPLSVRCRRLPDDRP